MLLNKTSDEITDRYYNRKGEAISLKQYAELMANRDYVILSKTKVGEAEVSTVWLGINHAFGNGPPLIFETMCFGKHEYDIQERYSTQEGALAGHEAIVARLLADSGTRLRDIEEESKRAYDDGFDAGQESVTAERDRLRAEIVSLRQLLAKAEAPDRDRDVVPTLAYLVLEADRDALWNKLADTQVELDNCRGGDVLATRSPLRKEDSA